jgi:hypothetical protein
MVKWQQRFWLTLYYPFHRSYKDGGISRKRMTGDLWKHASFTHMLQDCGYELFHFWEQNPRATLQISHNLYTLLPAVLYYSSEGIY